MPHVVSVEPPQGITVRRGAEFDFPLKLIVRPGYHINSNTPAEEYLIPTVLVWEPGALAPKSVAYPKAETVRYEFSAKPLLVYSGTVTIVTRFAVARGASPGAAMLNGKLRYQACNDKMCLAPRTLEVSTSVKVE